MKTEAALLVQTGTPLVVAEIDDPRAQARAKCWSRSSIPAPAEPRSWNGVGDKGEDKWVPHCLGHEGPASFSRPAAP